MIQFERCNSIHDIPASSWDKLFNSSYPFTKHAFLAALEDSQSVCAETGWEPAHIIGKEENDIVLLAPCYLKFHSYGEYVFDWSWANAYQQNGLEYYPKLLCAIPFTPATGPRMAYRSEDHLHALIQAFPNLAEQANASGSHILFPESNTCSAWLDQGWVQRQNTQFHWYNEQFTNFDDFLDRFSSRKRKNLKKERRRIEEQGLVCKIIEGRDADNSLWESFYTCYQVTYLKRSGHQGYLTREFFMQIAQHLADSIVLNIAYEEGDVVACALCFKDDDNLYGRYWGCLQEYDQLHFELCYYQGIEYCIREKLSHFDPGAQGEHKIQRGFQPITTVSLHKLVHEGFQEAVARFCRQEARENSLYQQQAAELLPFKSDQ
jgi:predicted N-acyltransferase